MLWEEGMLVLKGWQEDSRRLRVEVETSDLRTVFTCTISTISEAHVVFYAADANYLEMSLADCTFDFGDAKESNRQMAIGETAESALSAIRERFHLIVVALE